jgi:MFS family permease
VYSQLYGLLSVYTEYVGLQPYAFGVLFAVNGGMVVALQIPIRKVTQRIGSEKAFALAQFLFAAGFSYFMLSKDLNQFLVGAVILTLGEITFFPASSGFIANLSPVDKRGRYLALSGLFFGVGGSVGALIGFRLYGVLLHKELVWAILGAVGFATLPGYMYLLNARQKKPNSPQVISKNE